MPEKPFYFYASSVVLFATSLGSCYQYVSTSQRAHDDADRLYVNGERYNSEYAQARLEELNYSGHLKASAFALLGSAGMALGGAFVELKAKKPKKS